MCRRSEIQDQVADFSPSAIVGSHCGDHEDCCHLGCDTMQSGRCFVTFVVRTCPYQYTLFEIKIKSILMGYPY